MGVRTRGGSGMRDIMSKFPDAFAGCVDLPDGGKLWVYDTTCDITGGPVRRYRRQHASGRIQVEDVSLKATNEGQIINRTDTSPRFEGDEGPVSTGAAPALVRMSVPAFAKAHLGKDFGSRQEYDTYMRDNKLYVPTIAEARNRLPTAPNVVHRKKEARPPSEDGDGVSVFAATEPKRPQALEGHY